MGIYFILKTVPIMSKLVIFLYKIFDMFDKEMEISCKYLNGMVIGYWYATIFIGEYYRD